MRGFSGIFVGRMFPKNGRTTTASQQQNAAASQQQNAGEAEGLFLSRGGCEAYLVTLTDGCSFLCVSGQRGTIAKSMYEEHLCVVALTSIERGTQFFPLASYFLA